MDPANRFLDQLPTKARNKAYLNMKSASIHMNSNLFKKVLFDLWEFRVQYYGNQYRLLAFWDRQPGRNTKVVVTNGFMKKTNKVPRVEIEKALYLKTVYFNSI
jgi:phage-related protein